MKVSLLLPTVALLVTVLAVTIDGAAANVAQRRQKRAADLNVFAAAVRAQLESCKPDICFAIDSSNSLTEAGLQDEKNFVMALMREIASFGQDVQARYAAVIFATNVSLIFDFNVDQSLASLDARIAGLPFYKGRTNIPDAMELCREALTNPVYGPRAQGDRSAAVAIVLTDGEANEGQITIAEAARRMALSGIKSLAVGAGPGIDNAQLLEVAQGRTANVFSVGSTAELVDIAQNIGVSSCADIDTTTTTSTTPSAECRWGDWSPCDAPCGGGIQRRSMDCCDCTPRVEIRSCNRDPCPVDGAWGPWSDFGACSQSCGGGQQIRTRSCNNPPVAGDGQPCQGPSAELQGCNDQGCPVNGQWGDWCCSWSECSATCGGGQRTRTRQCSNPAPANGGADCVGSNIEEEICNSQPCPTDGGWSNWSDWSGCNVNTCTCSRTRTCTSPAPRNGGKLCMGDYLNQRPCFVFCCLPDFARSLGFGGRLPGPFGGMGFGGMGGGRTLGGKSWMRC